VQVNEIDRVCPNILKKPEIIKNYGFGLKLNHKADNPPSGPCGCNKIEIPMDRSFLMLDDFQYPTFKAP